MVAVAAGWECSDSSRVTLTHKDMSSIVVVQLQQQQQPCAHVCAADLQLSSIST
jgi:hypothetical protein